MWIENEQPAVEIHKVKVPHLGSVPIAKGDIHSLTKAAQDYLVHWIDVCKPNGVFICDGNQNEANEIIQTFSERATLHRPTAYKKNYVCLTDPKDVARVKAKTYICSDRKRDTVLDLVEGVHGVHGQWISPKDLDKALSERLPGCMAGRMMYVIPFSMGPIGSPLSRVGIKVTDSNNVVLCMRTMTLVSPNVWDVIADISQFVKCVHSVKCPRNSDHKVINHWPCNPEKTLLAHLLKERMIVSFGSGYGRNSLLGKKCFALRIAKGIAHDEGWLPEHMLIMSVTHPQSEDFFIFAAFHSARRMTNMAMSELALPGCVGDDIAWMHCDENGVLHAINPEAGFFGVAPGTNRKTNPNALATWRKNTIFTNIAKTVDGRYYWDGLEDDFSPHIEVATWLGSGAGLATPLAAQWHIPTQDSAVMPTSARLSIHPGRTPKECPFLLSSLAVDDLREFHW